MTDSQERIERLSEFRKYLGPPEKAATAAGQQRWLIASLVLVEHQAITPCARKGSELAVLTDHLAQRR